MLDSLFSNWYVAFAGLVIGFGLLIFVHELGHFLVAKWVGVRATQFAIGFGNAICTYRKGQGLRLGSSEKDYKRQAFNALSDRGVDADQATERQVHEAADSLGLGETEYRLNTLPLGGYVKMLGQEDMDPTSRSDDPRSFTNQSGRARLAIFSAGVVMNVIFGAILLAGAFMIGVRFPAAQVGLVVPSQPAANTFADGHQGEPKYLGLRSGDQIVEVNGDRASDFLDLRLATALDERGDVVPIKVRRAGEAQPLTFRITPRKSRQTGLLSAGVTPGYTLRIQRIPTDSDAYKNDGVRADMVITAVDGHKVETLSQYIHAINDSGGKPVTLSLKDPDSGASAKTTITPSAALSPRKDGPPNLMGLTPPAEVVYVQDDSPAQKAGVKKGDLIARVGQLRWPMNVLDVAGAVKQADGQPITLSVWRDGSIKDLGTVTAESGKIGVGVEPLTDKPIIGGVLDDSPATQLHNLPSGSQITAVNGHKVKNWADLQRLLGALKAEASKSPEPAAQDGSTDSDDQASAQASNEGSSQPASDQTDQPADSDSVDSAESAGQSRSGAPVGSTDRSAKAAATVKLTIKLALAGQPTETHEIALTQQDLAYLRAARWMPPLNGLGLGQNLTLVKGANPLDSALIGLRKTKQFMVQTYVTVVRLFQGTVGLRHLRGPVGIVDEGTKFATRGFSYLLFFLGLISVNLAVINFLPIPIVDGGHVLFLAIEKIKGSPVSVRIQTWASIAGLALIGFVFLSTLYYDVGRLDLFSNLHLFGG